jgi:malate dehydrogenase (quinone)
MIDVIERCFSDKLESGGWKEGLKAMIPSYGESLIENADLLRTIRQDTLSTLKLNE